LKIVIRSHFLLTGINRSCYLLAKAKYLAYEMDAAEKLLRKCIEREQGMVEAHLLIAQVKKLSKL
jgi:hypothetical protein